MPPVRRLTAILAADVAGYSRLMGQDEEGTHERLKAHLGELVDPKIKEHRGRTVKNIGDGFLAEFASVVDAVRCAVEVQRGMVGRNAGIPADQRIEFRVGINLGDVLADGDDIFGDGVNVAARLEGLAEPGGICISRVVRDQVRDRLDCIFEDLGEQSVKNIARPLRAYRIPLDTAARSPPIAAAGAAPNPPLPLPDKPSIAVLPFQNMSGDPEQEYFADGMVEEIITALSRIRWLFVIARNSSFTYKGQAVNVTQVGRELGVRYVLEGSVRKAGSRVRIAAQLIDAMSGTHLWADRFDGALDDIFELQDQVANGVVGTVEPRLRQSEIERAIRKPLGSLDAYDLYLRSLALRNTHTDESVREAIALLKQALAIDPGYAPAAASIGWCRVYQLSQARSPISEAEVAEAVTLAKQALEAGKDDPDVLWIAASTLLFFTGAHEIAAAAIDRALMLNPNSAHAWMARGYVLLGRDQPDPAIAAFESAIRLSPLDWLGRAFTNGIASAHLSAGRYEEALDWANRTLREEPGYRQALRSKVVACARLDRIEEARETLRLWIESQPGLTIEGFRAFWSRVFSPEILAIYVDGLRKAGLLEG